MPALVLLVAQDLHRHLQLALNGGHDREREALHALGRQLSEHLELRPADHVQAQQDVQLTRVGGTVVGADVARAEALQLGATVALPKGDEGAEPNWVKQVEEREEFAGPVPHGCA